MAINWRREADNIISTDDIFENNGDILDIDNETSDIYDPTDCKTAEFECKYGKFIVNQEPDIKPQYISSNSTNIGCTVEIDFEPNKETVDASEIAFVQIIQWLDTANGNKTVSGMSGPKVNPYVIRSTKEGWWLDRSFAFGYPPGMHKWAWYGYPNSNAPQSTPSFERRDVPIRSGICTGKNYQTAYFCDTPSEDITDNKTIIRESVRFEVYAIAKQGKQQNKIYGGIFWGFDYSHLPLSAPNNKFEHKVLLSKIKFLENPSNVFKKCVQLWNDQASRPPDAPSVTSPTKNSPDQQPLNIF